MARKEMVVAAARCREKRQRAVRNVRSMDEVRVQKKLVGLNLAAVVKGPDGGDDVRRQTWAGHQPLDGSL
jgi:hypothetical protein